MTEVLAQSSPVLCVFDPQYRTTWPRNNYHEIIELKHPLIQWILSEYENDSQAIYRCAAVVITSKQSNIPLGQYVYMIQRWESYGSVDRKELKYFAASIDGAFQLDDRDQEMLIKVALSHGLKWHVSSNELNRNRANACLEELLEHIQTLFHNHMESVRIDNEIRKQKQIRYAQSMRNRKKLSVQSRLDGLIATGKSESIIKATRGQLESIEENYQRQLKKIDTSRFEPVFDDVAVGIIKVEE